LRIFFLFLVPGMFLLLLEHITMELGANEFYIIFLPAIFYLFFFECEIKNSLSHKLVARLKSSMRCKAYYQSFSLGSSYL
jgi:hypothetical protein